MYSFLKKKFPPLIKVMTLLAIILLVVVIILLLPGLLENQDQQTAMVTFTGIVAFSTLVYAILTWRLVDETIEMRKVQTDPNVSIIIEPREERMALINLKIRNVGSGPAYDIRFKITPDFEYFKGKNLSQIMEGITYLAPNQKRQFFLTDLREGHDKKINNPFEIKAAYKDKSDKNFEETFIIDFSEFEGMFEREPPLHRIADSLDSIKEKIGDLTKRE